ncbi:MAG: hypothetical protein HZA95_01505 [Candidatus Vogelbacteria bacterium]|nr:hypothetical protein [Candidatus Vogelbacteria bacterium]
MKRHINEIQNTDILQNEVISCPQYLSQPTTYNLQPRVHPLQPTTYNLQPNSKQGSLLIQALIFGTIAIVIIAGLINWVGVNLKATAQTVSREQAFQVAEAGIEYYRWHLAHSPEDFKDGTSNSGPYVHNMNDKNGVKIGQFSLSITPPIPGSTKVILRSTGTVVSDPTVSRTIEAELAIQSIAKFSLLTNATLRMGAGTEVFGPVHANGGIHFDGLAHNIISSALATYNDPDYSGSTRHGVYTLVSPADPVPPTPIQDRPDVFMSGREFPLPAVDFTSITNDLSDFKTEAETSGLYFPASGKSGYHFVLKPNDTMDVYRVDSLAPVPNGCPKVTGQNGWGGWSVQGETFVANYVFPQNGLIFAEDNLWVDGRIDGARITIAAGKFPENQGQGKSITINSSLLYTNYNGQDSIGLIGQENINVGLVSADTLRIDAALIAKNGRAGRYYYRPPEGQNRCAPYHARSSLTLYGMLASNARYGFSYTDSTGYITRNIIYDANLLYAPPPNFPLLSSGYSIQSWREVGK